MPENLEQDQDEKEYPQVDAELVNHGESPLDMAVTRPASLILIYS